MKINKEQHLLHLATFFASEEPQKVIIEKALRYICTHFSFDLGTIYESDQQNQFHMKEYFTKKELLAPCHFSFEQLPPDFQNVAAQKEALYLHKENLNAPYTQAVLEYCKSYALLSVPLYTHKNDLQGLIFFSTATQTPVLTTEELVILNELLRLFAIYVCPRIYQNMLDFTQVSMECILDHAGIDIYINDFYTHDILYVNKSMAAPYGGQEAFSGQKCWNVLFPGKSGQCDFCPQYKLVDENGNRTSVYTWDYQRPFDGSWFRVFSSAFRWMDGRLAHMVCSADITENKKNEETIAYMANYDVLTNLPNRRKLIQDFTKCIDSTQNNQRGFVLFFDIDGFKKVNDIYGHDAGDELLIKLGEFFINIPLLKDVIYRNGGDEFVALIMGEHISKEHIINLLGFIHERFKKPWQLKKGTVYCNTSVGIAAYPEDGLFPEDLLSVADKAMYAAKNLGEGKFVFGEDLRDKQST